MGVTRTDIYTQEINRISSMAKVLGHPARLTILQHLLKKDTCICGELVEEIGLAQATISQHLREMKSIGLIKGNIEGTSVCYCINKEVFTQMKEDFNSIFNLELLADSSCK